MLAPKGGLAEDTPLELETLSIKLRMETCNLSKGQQPDQIAGKRPSQPMGLNIARYWFQLALIFDEFIQIIMSIEKKHEPKFEKHT